MKTHNSRISGLLLLLLLPLALISCSGSSGDGFFGLSRKTNGTLVVPDNAQSDSAGTVLSGLDVKATGVKCEMVPAGYKPLQATKVEFLGKTGDVVGITESDQCGKFSADVQANVTAARVNAAGYRDLQLDVSYFQQATPGLASMLPESAEYKIASIQLAGKDSLAFTVTDSITNKAVIGLPETAVNISVNASPAEIIQYNSATETSESASVVLVMDASPSMQSIVRDKQGNELLDANGQSLTRYRMSALAAHLYLDSVNANDETAFVIFDSNAVFIDDATIASLFEIRDRNAQPATYTFSKDGFSSTASVLRFVADAYNPYSSLYNNYAYDARHPDTPNLTIESYPWGSYTAMYDGIYKGLEKVSVRTNYRTVIIAMSDGEDNSSVLTEQEVIARAKQDGTPVYTITYGEITGTEQGGADVESMARIANQTNATPFLVEGPDIGTAFQSIQSGITYQYLAVLDRVIAEGDTLDLTLSFSGLSVSRSLKP